MAEHLTKQLDGTEQMRGFVVRDTTKPPIRQEHLNELSRGHQQDQAGANVKSDL